MISGVYYIGSSGQFASLTGMVTERKASALHQRSSSNKRKFTVGARLGEPREVPTKCFIVALLVVGVGANRRRNIAPADS